MATERPQVFLSYAHENLEQVRRLYEDLVRCRVNVWFDKEHMGPGRWKRQIERAIPKSRFFLVCLSEAALKKTGDEPGFQDEELQQAYEIAREQPEASFTIIPVRLEDCGRGDHRLSPYQQYDLFENWDVVVKRLATWLGGSCARDDEPHGMQDHLTERQQLVIGFMGKVYASYYAKEYTRMLHFTEAVLDAEPENTEARKFRGVAFGLLDRMEEALQVLESVAEQLPRDAEVWNNIGIACDELGFPEEALAAYEQAVKLRSDYADAWYGKGKTLAELNRLEEALAAYKHAAELHPKDSDAWVNIGVVLYDLGRFEEALAAYEQAAKLSPNSPDVWFNKGNALNELGRIEEALKAYVQATELRLNYVEAWTNQAVMLGLLGRWTEALRAIERAVEIGPDRATVWRCKGALLREMGRAQEAQVAFEKSRRLSKSE